MTRRILLTGFEPFAEFPANPSLEVAKTLDGRALGDVVVRSAILPVHHTEAARHVERALEETDPLAVVHLGLAGGRARIALERVAVNVMDYESPDNAGYQARGEPCVPDGPPAYFASLPLPAMLAALTAEGIPAYLSNTAGTYLCNQTMYGTLHALARHRHPARAGFIHFPLLPAMVAASGLEQPSMDLALMVRAIEIVLGVVVATAA
ncbi:MAG TPA: pyroglutamyl-peptidase I [Methylomirabilota bacterium]|jgi:pyroglutamyl-peptidase|nr:pyroglutamyl-peptidase I [Methylomirabilota bacterium]